MPKEVYVPKHKWSLGRNGIHPGYWREKRPKGKKRIIGKKPYKLYEIRDQYGQFKGWKRKR